MKFLFLACFFVIIHSQVLGQLVDDFDDMDFPTNPSWTGDTEDFIVNDALLLQLNAPDAGFSNIFSQLSLSDDTISFALKFRMDFNPSGSNQLRVYYAIDDIELGTASGYYFEIGETGSDDALIFYRSDNGVPTEIAVASLGSVAENPNVNLRIDYFPGGLWAVNTDYTGGTFLEEDLLFTDDEYEIGTTTHFGLSMNYTSSRTDLYFFDDISIKPFEQDKTGPTISEVEIISSNKIQITFSEPTSSESALKTSNYIIDNNINPASIEIVDPTISEITFIDDLPADKSFSITISSIEDLFGNTMAAPETFELNYARHPAIGDIIINEILFAPAVDEEDYVELRNLTTDFLDLSNIFLGNITKSGAGLKPILSGTILAPESYIVFTEQRDIVVSTFQLANGDNIIEQSIPDYNNDAGNVLLANADASVLDSYDYNEDQHNELLGIVKGVSLERTSSMIETNDPLAWTSASKDVGFGTPGYENSAAFPTLAVEDNFTFVEKVFSPDGDNDRDIMILGYNLDKSGYVANIEVRDVGGFLIKKIKSNETLSTSGIITWDGIDMGGKLSNIGMYIIVGKVFHSDGEIIDFKKVCVLAGRFE